MTISPARREPMEARVAAAFRARAETVDLTAAEVDERYRALRGRAGRRAAARRPRTVVALVAASAAAVALFLALAGSGGLLTTSPAPPAGVPATPTDPVSVPATPTDPAEPPLAVLGYAQAAPFTAYTVEGWDVPLSFVTGELPSWAGNWARDRSDVGVTIGLESASAQGHPSVNVHVLEQTYDPSAPWTQQSALVPAPADVQGWLDWVAATPLRTGDPETVLVGGVEAQRVSYTVPEDLGPAYAGCFPGRGCIGLQPLDRPGSGAQAGFGEGTAGDVYALAVDGRAALVITQGTASERERWEPVLDGVVASITWS